MSPFTLLSVAAASVSALLAALALGALLLLRRISASVGVAPPTRAQLRERAGAAGGEPCALFRHLPQLAPRLAWRALGAVPNTPVHVCRVPRSGTDAAPALEFCAKREDLISPRYGGNKVRTLQHQLAVCEARRERGEPAFRQLVALGSGGSNQVVAMVVHARGLGWDGGATAGEDAARTAPPRTAPAPASVNVCWFDKDAPDLDNTLNMLSVLSFPSAGFRVDWGDRRRGRLAALVRALVGAWTQTDFVPFMLGGNAVAGVLGQVGGVLELAEQIAAGESPDPRRIYVPVGSGCTLSGLIVGTVLVRRLGLAARTGRCLSDPDFKIVGCNVHEHISFLDRAVNFHVHPLFSCVPLTITHTVKGACRALKQLGGPDLAAEALEFIRTSVEIRADAAVVGTYGGHSEQTRAAAQRYDARGAATDAAGRATPPLWLCGHFAAKAFQPLVHDLEAAAATEEHAAGESNMYMLWMTKSAVQPRGDGDEWRALTAANESVKEWADRGKSESLLRPGRVSTADGAPGDYRALMTHLSQET